MMRGMFSAISGLKVNQTMLDVTANDLANVNTVGYKSARTTFQDSLAQLQRGAAAPGPGTGGSNAVQVGLGVQLGSIDNLMTQGAPQTTGAPLDVYIQGTGWFRVGSGTPDPADPTTNIPAQLLWTRAGNFTTNADGYLITADGHYVIGREVLAGPPPSPGPNDSYIRIPPGSTDPAIAQDGAVSYVDRDPLSPTYGRRVIAGYLALGRFANEAGLQRVGGSFWMESAASGPAMVETPGVNGTGVTLGGMLEMSNVDLATQFTTMITAQRGFQANSRVISTSDEMLQDLVNLKR